MWLWKGTQSAIFYYASLSPCYQYNYNRNRRKEARTAGKERAELEMSQPGILRQPVPFQTNPYWAEEIEAGPGPPRGWRKQRMERKANGEGGGQRAGGSDGSGSRDADDIDASITTTRRPNRLRPRRASESGLVPATAASSSPLDALRDTIRSSMPRPDRWNWERYDRDDETLFGINDRISRLWNRRNTDPEHQQHQNPLHHHRRRRRRRRKSASTANPNSHINSNSNSDSNSDSSSDPASDSDSGPDSYNWRYANNPAVNDLHPPTVNQFPRTKREVAWIKQPPPSRAVMEGKVPPEMEYGHRRPLCKVGGVRVREGSGWDSGRVGRTGWGGSGGGRFADGPDRNANGGAKMDVDEEDDGDDEDDDDDYDDSLVGQVIETLTGSIQNTAPPGPSQPGHDPHQRIQTRISSPPHLISSSPSPSQSPSPPSCSPLKRPPLAVLLDPNSRTKIHSYHLPIPITPPSKSKSKTRSRSKLKLKPLVPYHTAPSSPSSPSSPSRYGFDLDVVMGVDVVLQQEKEQQQQQQQQIKKMDMEKRLERLERLGMEMEVKSSRDGKMRYSLPDVRVGEVWSGG